jgi:hypothetical protein
LCLAASTLATLVSPYGWKIYAYVGTTSATAAGRGIDEWLPPTLDLFLGKMWVASLLLVLVAFALPRRRPTVREVCLVLCLLPLASGSARMVVWWLLATAPLLAASFAAQWPRLGASDVHERPSLAATGAFGLLVLLVVLSVPGLAAYNPLLAARPAAPRTQADLEAVAGRLPVSATPGRIFSRFEWGEYLTWALSPHYTVFMDGRIEVYPDEVWAQYTAVTRGADGWAEILDRYRVDYLLLDAPYHADTGLLPRVEQSAAWQRAFQAGDAVLFVRRPPSEMTNDEARMTKE